MSHKPYLLLIIVVFSGYSHAAEWVGRDLRGKPCEGITGGFGPYDYFDVDEPSDPKYNEGRYWEADKVHTDKAVNLMKMGRRVSPGDHRLAGQNIDYTLRAYPNDPRSLNLVVQYHEITMERKDLVNPIPPPECYFQRAISFRPDQFHIRILYGIYFFRNNHLQKAVTQFRAAVDLNENSAEGHYNLGIVLLELGELEQAEIHAEKAYDLGHPLPGLKRRINKLKAGRNK